MALAPSASAPVPARDVPEPLSPRDQAAYAALAGGAAWWPAPLAWCSVLGEHAAPALNGLVSNAVVALDDGQGQLAVTLTPKGKVITDLVVLREAAGCLRVATPPQGMDPWLAILRKYVNPRLARTTDERDARLAVVVAGGRAASLLAPLTALGDGAVLEALAPWAHVAGTLGEFPVRVVACPRWGGVSAFWLLADAAGSEEAQRWLEAQGVVGASPAVGEVLRVEGGAPRLGADMDERTIPQEANLDQLGAISFAKGCYTGQETVARVHFRGHVNRHLRGVRLPRAVPAGASVVDAEGKVVGAVTSGAVSPRLGALALAMVRREVPVGAPVAVVWDDPAGAGRAAGTVAALPFAG